MVSIYTNSNALKTARQLNQSESTQKKLMESLASGKRINSAKDDPAGLNIAALFTSQVNGMNQAIRNAYDGISMSQTAEGALSTSADMLQRMRELAVQASNSSYSAADRQALQDEINQLGAGLNDIATGTRFNGQNLLDGTMGAQQFQVGANAGDLVSIGGTNFQTSTYGNNTIQGGAIQPGTAIGAGSMTINGSLGSATISTAQGASARDVAAAINAQTDNTGVTATAQTTANLNGLQAGMSYSFEMSSNNSEAVGVSFTVGANGDLTSAVNAFNQVNAKTGVIASTDAVNGGIRLTNNSGETIGLQLKPGSNINPPLPSPVMSTFDSEGNKSAETNITDQAVVEAQGTVNLNSTNSFSVVDNTPAAKLDNSSKLNSVASISVATFEDAQKAITTIDSALNAISRERASYGAMQNRFESTISNLMTNSVNSSASRSRILDTDYAQAVSEDTRAQLLQRVGVAMQAQANQIPQMVLSLLK